MSALTLTVKVAGQLVEAELSAESIDALREALAAEPDGPMFLTVAQAATELSTTPKAVYAMVDRGHLPARKAGRRLMIPRAALTALGRR